MATQAGAYAGSFSVRRQKIYFYSPLDGLLVHREDTSDIKLAGSYLYTGWREALRE